MTSGSEPAVYVELIDAAIGDLEHLARHAPAAPKWALKKMLLLESNPEAGEPLLGSLVGWRKIVVGDRGWRIVWRVRVDGGTSVVEVAEVWAAGARSDSEVYEEMHSRIARLPASPQTTALAEVIEQIGKLATGIAASRPPAKAEPLPGWLVDRLVHTADIDRSVVEAMDLQMAVDAWTAWRSGGAR